MKDLIDTNICSECGAKLLNSRSCQNYFDALLAIEFSDPKYGIVHHLSVPAYMLQHPSRLSTRGWIEMRNLLSSFIQQGKSPTEVRRADQKLVQNTQRSFSYTKGDSINVDNIIWTKTISDIRMEDASAYCQDVQEWACQILKDLKELEMRTSRTN